MAAGEGCRGTLASLVGHVDEEVERAVRAGRGIHGTHLVEVVPHVGEDAVDGIHALHLVVVLRAGHGQEYINNVVEEKAGHDDEARTHQFVGPLQPREEDKDEDHREVRHIAQVERFTDPPLREVLAEEQGGLATEQLMVPGGEDVVVAGEESVELVCVGVPAAQRAHDAEDAQELRGAAGVLVVDEVEQGQPAQCHGTLAQHGERIDQLPAQDGHQQQGEGAVGHHGPFEWPESLLHLIVVQSGYEIFVIHTFLFCLLSLV